MVRRIGSLWIKRKNNKTYLTGEIEIVAGIKTKVAVMKNENKKTGSKQPDYHILLLKQDKKQNADRNLDRGVNLKVNDEIFI